MSLLVNRHKEFLHFPSYDACQGLAGRGLVMGSKDRNLMFVHGISGKLAPTRQLRKNFQRRGAYPENYCQLTWQLDIVCPSEMVAILQTAEVFSECVLQVESAVVYGWHRSQVVQRQTALVRLLRDDLRLTCSSDSLSAQIQGSTYHRVAWRGNTMEIERGLRTHVR